MPVFLPTGYFRTQNPKTCQNIRKYFYEKNGIWKRSFFDTKCIQKILWVTSCFRMAKVFPIWCQPYPFLHPGITLERALKKLPNCLEFKMSVQKIFEDLKNIFYTKICFTNYSPRVKNRAILDQDFGRRFFRKDPHLYHKYDSNFSVRQIYIPFVAQKSSIFRKIITFNFFFMEKAQNRQCKSHSIQACLFLIADFDLFVENN